MFTQVGSGFKKLSYFLNRPPLSVSFSFPCPVDYEEKVPLVKRFFLSRSAALGLAIAAAVGFGYSNIFVTSPSPENLHTLFEFIFKGFDAMAYEEHSDYDLVQSTNPEFNNAVVRVNIHEKNNHRQTIQYVHPTDAPKLGQAELVVIDEAAAIPLPLVKELLGPYLVFMSSTINGYEGTGRSLSLKLLEQLRKQSNPTSVKAQSGKDNISFRMLREVTLEESIRSVNCLFLSQSFVIKSLEGSINP